MDRAAREDGPENSIFGRDRRRSRRHRVHSPAYASLSGSSQGAGVELSEILDIGETGMCIQASSPMKINRLLPLCLELSATSSRIYLVGHVVWSDSSGRTGIRFPEVSAPELKQLQDWLETNAKSEAAAQVSVVQSQDHCGNSRDVQQSPTSSPSYTSLVNEWVEIEKEVDSCGPDLDPALHLIAQRALTLTWASGTAIALINSLEPSEMICRARAGSDSPEIGARLDSNSGFSGACVRGATAISCDDTEYDSRVDRKSCRALGIRSIVACPVKRGKEVIGILEVFSPEPAAFWENDVTVLQRLATITARAVTRAQHERHDVLAFATAPRESTPAWMPEASAEAGGHLLRRLPLRAALVVAGVMCFGVAIWMSAPWLSKLTGWNSTFSIPSSAEADSSGGAYALMSLSDLRRLAGQGDPRAEYALGKRYVNGDGVRKDYRVAKDWFLAAAEQGHIAAQAKVAAAFWSGKGAAQDYSKAYYWAMLAQAGGDRTSPAIVMNSAAHLSPAQIAAEEKQADQWLHSHHIGTASK
jgi:putative methionine-R-sulfoxide reductase with GAF domain